MIETVVIRELGLQEYSTVWQQLKSFTQQREPDTIDQLWFLEHLPVYTQGQAGRPEHILNPGAIPIVQSDRGGQVTYHGPGQLIVYFLTDLARKNLNVRQIVTLIEESVIELLATYGITAHTIAGAPGIYVNQAKIGSIGLRVRHGRTYHGLSLNVNMDLEPFTRINPCGYTGLDMTQVSELGVTKTVQEVAADLLPILMRKLKYK